MSRLLKKEEISIEFNIDQENALRVKIETPHLIIRSVCTEDFVNYLSLFSDPEVMEKYATGQPMFSDPKAIEKYKTDQPLEPTDEKALQRLKDRFQRWINGFNNNDPFCGLSVFHRETGKFVGHIVLGRSGLAGIAEFAYLFHKEFWNQGIGTEAASAILNYYAIQICEKGYRLDDNLFSAVTATTRVDHLYSQKILEKTGLSTNKKEINYKFGAERYIYNADVLTLKKAIEEEVAPTVSLYSIHRTQPEAAQVVESKESDNTSKLPQSRKSNG